MDSCHIHYCLRVPFSVQHSSVSFLQIFARFEFSYQLFFVYFVLECRCFLNIDRESDEFENAANERIVHGAIGASSGVQLFAHDSLRPRFAQKLRLFPAHGEDAK